MNSTQTATELPSAELPSIDSSAIRCPQKIHPAAIEKSPAPQFTIPQFKAPQFKDALRIQGSITSAAERKLLVWLAARMPRWINSDHLTALGFVAMFLAGVSVHRVGWLLATLFLAVNWFGDSLDGTLARVRNRRRPRYGFYVDHMIDSFGAIFLMGGLAISRSIDWRIAAAMLVAFLLLSIETYLATYTLGKFRLSFALFGPTEIRILLAAANIAVWFRPAAAIPFFHIRLFDFGGANVRLFDFGGTIGAIGMLAMAIVAAILHTRELYRLESHPKF